METFRININNSLNQHACNMRKAHFMQSRIFVDCTSLDTERDNDDNTETLNINVHGCSRA